jgi:hypothetical protein
MVVRLPGIVTAEQHTHRQWQHAPDAGGHPAHHHRSMQQLAPPPPKWIALTAMFAGGAVARVCVCVCVCVWAEMAEMVTMTMTMTMTMTREEPSVCTLNGGSGDC